MIAGTAMTVPEFLPEEEGLIGGEALVDTEAGDGLVTVVHSTNEAGVNGIINSGLINQGSYVTLPEEIEGMSPPEIEQTLEINSGKGYGQFIFQTPISNLGVPANGPLTSGGAIQFQLLNPVSLTGP